MKTGIIKKILNNHLMGFLKLYSKKIRKNVKKEVEKVLKCKDIRYWYIEFKCDTCNITKKVGFTCKIRFCTSSGKVCTYKWVDNMLGKLINVKHRHIVFTIPEELRKLFGIDIAHEGLNIKRLQF